MEPDLSGRYQEDPGRKVHVGLHRVKTTRGSCDRTSLTSAVSREWHPSLQMDQSKRVEDAGEHMVAAPEALIPWQNFRKILIVPRRNAT